jgi:hypothetical protein
MKLSSFKSSVRSTFKTRGLLLLATACFLLPACAPAPVNREPISAAPEAGRALVIGWGNTPAEDARAAVKAERGTRVTRLFVASADGKKTPFGENIARLSPGDHDLIISCGMYIDYRFFNYDSAMRASLGANRVYRLRADPAGRRCEASLDDVTGKSG